MLRRRPEPVMCGRGLRALCPWETVPQEPPRASCLKQRSRSCRARWQRRGGGGRQGWGPPPRTEPAPPCQRLLRLRPVNLQGKRAPGMRAPRNTNQFLMHEKYQLLQLRSDSVGSAESGSDCEADPLDMYLGALENARGAVLEEEPPPRAEPGGCQERPRGLGGFLLQEDSSLQYFPSDDDVQESEHFMERDFQQFCSSIC